MFFLSFNLFFLQIKWNIMWDDTATIPTTTAVNKGGLIVGMVSTFTAVIVAVVVSVVV